MGDIIGTIPPPDALSNFGSVETGAFGKLLQLFINILIVAGGVYALFNIILAGYAFLGAGDDPKKIQGAWSKIYQTFMGLAFIAGAFVLAAIIGRILFGSWQALTYPVIPTIGP